MKAIKTFRLNINTVLLAALCFIASNAWAQPLSGLPEPGFVMYGTVTTTNGSPSLLGSGVVWRVATGGTASTNTGTIVVVNSQTFYVVRIPFETRSIPGTPAFTPTPNTLELTSANTTYTRSATVNGTNATLSPTSFDFRSADRGRIERVNLVVNLPFETFAQWAQRIFGNSGIDPNADADHDGASNMAEYLAGTDPLSDQSAFKFIGIQPLPSSGIIIQWSSVIGKTYTIFRSSAASTNYTQLGSPLPATNTVTSFLDGSATGPGPYFYRLRTQ